LALSVPDQGYSRNVSCPALASASSFFFNAKCKSENHLFVTTKHILIFGLMQNY
jgi:hypothetical protein